MSRYIDADRLIAHLKDEIEECDPKCGGRPDIAYGVTLGLKSAIAFAEALSADVVEVRHGEWLPSKYHYGFYVCSECGRHIEARRDDPEVPYPYCHCGAKMDGGAI